MPLQATSGAASYDGFGGGVAAIPNYIEDVFSTYLYTGNGSTQSINTGIDLTTKTGLVWVKCRTGAYSHMLQDTVRGSYKYIQSDNTPAQNTNPLFDWFKSFNSNGFTVAYTPSYGTVLNDPILNGNGQTYASWTFVKQPKFFDVVTYTGTGSNTTISHSLGSVPACIIVKRTDTTGAWQVYHRSLANTEYLVLNSTAAVATGATRWNSTTPTSTVFSIGTDATVNASGGTYVAYIFAHDAGGFGLTGTDNVISCGSFTTDASSVATVNLGYEPQWVLVKRTSGSTEDWLLFDNMRGLVSDAGYSPNPGLFPNTSGSENNRQAINVTSTGFISPSGGFLAASTTYIYIAIRRGPMKVPTSGTSVFAPVAITGTGTGGTVTSGFATDTVWEATRNTGRAQFRATKLTGTNFLTESTGAEQTALSTTYDLTGYLNTGVTYGTPGNSYLGFSGDTDIFWNFKRSPQFHDVVCYTGDGAASRNITHNLTVTPQLIFAKSRSNIANWVAYNFAGNGLILNSTAAANSGFNFITSATSTTFTPADPASYGGSPNQSGQTYVAYLFATCEGLSKVGSYTGTGATQTISCGFTGGARMVIIKRTDTTGIWYIWDTDRGMVAGTDPKTNLSTGTAETNANWVYTTTGGFQIVTSDVNVNASGGTYIYLAIA